MNIANLPQRKSIRLQDYDYSQAGYYFVTICAKDKKSIFGEILAPDNPFLQPIMQANHIGKIICQSLDKINEIYDNVRVDEYCLMPNHIHVLIVISEREETHEQNSPSLQKIIQGLKSVTTRLCFKYGYKNIWQRGYYEHIVRNEKELAEIREYIQNNPSKWGDDKYFV